MSKLIDWGTTGQIFVESLSAGVLVVAAFALGARLLPSPSQSAREPGADGPADRHGGRYVLAALCFAVAAAAAGFGVFFTIDK